MRRFEQPEVAAPVLPQNVIPLFCNGIIDLNPAPTGRARALRDVATENAARARNHMQEFVSVEILASSAELLPDLWTDFRLI